MKTSLILSLFLSGSLAFAEWKSDSEVGYVAQSGNTEQQSTYIKTNVGNTIGKNTYALNGQYINTGGTTKDVATGLETDTRIAESILVGLKYTRAISEKLGIYAGVVWDKNRFAGFDDRYAGDLGLRYDFFKTDTDYFFNETGYRYRMQYAHTLGSVKGPKTESNFGRVYLEYGRKLSETSNFRFWVENFYDFSDSENYEVNFEPSIDVALGEFFSSENPARISLKVAYKGMYDNVPATPGFKRFDSIMSTAIKVVY